MSKENKTEKILYGFNKAGQPLLKPSILFEKKFNVFKKSDIQILYFASNDIRSINLDIDERKHRQTFYKSKCNETINASYLIKGRKANVWVQEQ